MDISQADQIIEELYFKKGVRTEEETHLLIETLEYKIHRFNDDYAASLLADVYYCLENYDLSVKYNEIVLSGNNEEYKVQAAIQIAYIYYYGRTGHKDYQKAYEYYTYGANSTKSPTNMCCKYKLADMYKNGYYVEKDYEKYKSIVRELYDEVKDARYLHYPLPEIFTRLARIEKEEGHINEALRLYFIAINFLSQRIVHDHFFGNFNIMKWSKEDVYTMIDIDEYDLDLYDLYVVLKAPHKVQFIYENQTYIVESKIINNYLTILFNNQQFRDVDLFMQHAKISDHYLYEIYNQLYNMEVIE